MPKTKSPLRYPGGKTKIYNLIKPIISQNYCGNNFTYIEPFAGGCGLALQLLFCRDVDRLVLNDIDYGIYCFWDACLNNAHELCELIDNCEVNMNIWAAQRVIHAHPFNHTPIEVAFSTFYLNRCNVSGIISGGPIGGHAQTGNYGLDARFNKISLIDKIYWIYGQRERIEFFNLDAHAFIQNVLPNYNINETILNIDPPYVKKGPVLYRNSFSIQDHSNLAQLIGDLNYKWMVTYDECDTIYDLYSRFRKEIIILNYSVGHTKSGSELLIYSDTVDLNF